MSKKHPASSFLALGLGSSLSFVCLVPPFEWELYCGTRHHQVTKSQKFGLNLYIVTADNIDVAQISLFSLWMHEKNQTKIKRFTNMWQITIVQRYKFWNCASYLYHILDVLMGSQAITIGVFLYSVKQNGFLIIFKEAAFEVLYCIRNFGHFPFPSNWF